VTGGLSVLELANKYTAGDRGTSLALLAVVRSADARGSATFNDVAARYRVDYLAQLRLEGRDAEREAGRLSLDEVRAHLRAHRRRGVVVEVDALHLRRSSSRYSDSYCSTT